MARRRTSPRTVQVDVDDAQGAAPQQPLRSDAALRHRELFGAENPAAMAVGRAARCGGPNQRTPLPAGLNERQGDIVASLEMFDLDPFHEPEFGKLMRAARDFIAERVRRGGATSADV